MMTEPIKPVHRTIKSIPPKPVATATFAPSNSAMTTEQDLGTQAQKPSDAQVNTELREEWLSWLPPVPELADTIGG